MTPTFLLRPTFNSNVLERGLVAGALAALFFFSGPAWSQDDSSAMASSQEDEDEAEEERAYYFEMSAGPSFVPNQTLQGDGGAGGDLMGRVETDTGYYVGGAVGTDFLDQLLRAEIAFSYHEADVDKARITATGPPTDGELSLITLMANGYVDLHLGIGIIPYAGFGIGWGVVKYDFRTKEAGVFEVDDTDSVFVYNAMVGGRIPLTEVSELSLGYRYIATEDIRVQSTVEGSSQWLDAEFDAHEITIALRFNF